MWRVLNVKAGRLEPNKWIVTEQYFDEHIRSDPRKQSILVDMERLYVRIYDLPIDHIQIFWRSDLER